MRSLTFLFLFLFGLAPACAADTDLAGRFTGDWKSSGGGAAGTFRMSLEPGAGGAWKCEVTFTLGDQEVKTTMREVKVGQGNVEIAYDFDAAGNTLRSRITGKLSGNKIEGQYRTTAVEGGAQVDEGTWNAARAK